MQNTSILYNQILAGPHTHEVKLRIAGRDYGMDMLASNGSADCAAADGSQPG